MTRRWFFGALLVLALPFASDGEEKTGKPSTAPANSAFETVKKLEGTWLVASEDGKPTDQVGSIIRVTAGGSAVHETLFPGQSEEMLSVYTVEGSDLVMTHYCVLGNQPRLKADPKSPANQIVFQFAGGANLDPAKDAHIHSVTLKVVDDSHIEVAGLAWRAGAPAKDLCCGLKMVRKK